MVILKLTSSAIDSTVHINSESVIFYYYCDIMKSTVIVYRNGDKFPYKESLEYLDNIFSDFITLFNPISKKKIRINPKFIDSYWCIENVTIMQFADGKQYDFKETPEEIDALLESK